MAEISHCIKNIIQGLNAGMFILKKDIKKTEADIPENSVEMMDRSLGRLKILIKDMLYYSKERKPEYGLVDINEECRSVIDVMGPKAEKKGIHIELEKGLDDPEVEIDHNGIFRCILNLVGNAIEATEKEDATITISTGSSGDDEFFVSIADQGSGMDEKTKDHLFDTFYSTKGSKGTGLGLSVTQKIITEHNGKIEVDSELGKGTTFTVVLPRKRPEGDLKEEE
jgi:signal transduction histidine kinase